MTKSGYLIKAAGLSKNSAALWFRYLNKEINQNQQLTVEELQEVLSSGELDAFQRVSLKLAARPGNPYHAYVVGLSQKARVPSVAERLEQYGL
jgi:hypothetical protein